MTKFENDLIIEGREKEAQAAWLESYAKEMEAFRKQAQIEQEKKEAWLRRTGYYRHFGDEVIV